MRIFILFAVLVTACTPFRVTRFHPHPGAMSNTDSISYDTMSQAQALLLQWDAERQAGTTAVPSPDVRRLMDAYQDARSAWHDYRETQQMVAGKASTERVDKTMKELQSTMKTYLDHRAIVR